MAGGGLERWPDLEFPKAKIPFIHHFFFWVLYENEKITTTSWFTFSIKLSSFQFFPSFSSPLITPSNSNYPISSFSFNLNKETPNPNSIRHFPCNVVIVLLERVFFLVFKWRLHRHVWSYICNCTKVFLSPEDLCIISGRRRGNYWLLHIEK